MIEERLKKLEEHIAAAAHIPQASREELLSLLAALRAEIAALPQAHTQAAHAIAAAAEASAHEATCPDREPRSLEAALEDLGQSVGAFETSHPQLAATINRISHALANMGM